MGITSYGGMGQTTAASAPIGTTANAPANNVPAAAAPFNFGSAIANSGDPYGAFTAGVLPTLGAAFQQAATSPGYQGPLTAGQSGQQDWLLQQAQNLSQGGAWMPWLQNAGGTYGQQSAGAGNISSGLDAAKQLWQQAGGTMSGAIPQLQQASAYDQSGMMQHLSPYLSGVLETIQQQGNKNLFENVLPGVNATFTSSGQFGSGRNADFNARAIRDAQQAILNAQGAAGNQAFGQAASDYLNWGQLGVNAAGKQADIGTQLGNLGTNQANTTANIFNAQAGALGQVGQNQAALGKSVSDLAWNDANSSWNMEEAARKIQDAALAKQYQAWLDAKNNQLGGINSIIGSAVNLMSPYTQSGTSTTSSGGSSSTTGAVTPVNPGLAAFTPYTPPKVISPTQGAITGALGAAGG